jgi:hypothetical protein
MAAGETSKEIQARRRLRQRLWEPGREEVGCVRCGLAEDPAGPGPGTPRGGKDPK